MSRSNKKSATEDDLGILHKGITRAFTKKVDLMLKKCQLAEEEDDEFALDLAIAQIDSRDLAAASKWVQANEITCASPEQQSGGELKTKLEQIKEKQGSKVIAFTQ